MIVTLLCASCATGPKYETAGPECLEYAIAACRAAIVDDGMEAGLIHYIPKWGDGTAHMVIWVRGKDNVERIYDPSFGIYRTISPNATILHKGKGLDIGIYARLLLPKAGRDNRVASNISSR
jgi:hypothetical protein